ncbi:hypothetical protein [Rhizobacter sp. Root1221]|uniref:hypothetical protein n=1 Tax=Rhizobacter sp. Root1221 TaxID=1736433 RepID=UPI0006F2B897|nr:hypothetical protein [Rhizobacter sp. Root1221]KQV85430.1 hypothetical protein ASC87_06990 [Rhizobacter sp. Root1221]
MATGKIANLSVGVSLDAAEFSNGLTKAELEARRFEQQMTTRAVAIGTAVGVGLAGAALELAQALPNMFSAAIDGLDAFNDLRDATGSSVENISALDDISRRAGGTFETVETSLVKLNKALQDAGKNDAAGIAIREIGLDVEALKKLDPAEALVQIAVALNGFETDANKAAVVSALFGKSMKELAPFLQDVADKGELVATATSDQAAEAEKYNKQLANLQANATNFARALTSEVIPALNQAFEYFRGDIEAGSFGGDAAQARARALSASLSKVTDELIKLREVDSPTSEQQSRIARLSKDVEVLSRNAAKASDEVKGIYGTGPAVAAPQEKLPDLAGQVEAAKKREEAEKKAAAEAARASAAGTAAAARAHQEAETYIDNLRKRIEKTEHLSEVERVAADIAAGRRFDDAAQAGAAFAAAARLDADKAAAAQKKSELETTKALASVQKQLADEVASMYSETRTPQEEYIARIERLDELFAAGRISLDLYGRAGQQAVDRMNGAAEKGSEAFKQATEAAKEAERSIQQTLGAELSEMLGGNFDDIGKRWVSLLQNMVAQALAADLIGSLTGKGGGNTDALVNGFAKLIGGAFGGGYNSGDTYQNGSYSEGTQFLPELATGTNFVPHDGFVASLHKGEAVVPAKYNPANGGGGGGSVTVENHGQDVQTRKGSDGNLRVIVRGMMREEMTSDLAAGGPISQAQRRTFGLSRQLERRG